MKINNTPTKWSNNMTFCKTDYSGYPIKIKNLISLTFRLRGCERRPPLKKESQLLVQDHKVKYTNDTSLFGTDLKTVLECILL